MANGTPAEKLTADLQEILKDYQEGLQEDLETVIRKAAQKAKATLKKTSPRSKGKGSYGKHYADQWAAREEFTRLTKDAVIYNKAPTYRLAHLLEYGHLTRDGRRVQGQPHIKPVEETVISMVTQGIRKAV